MNKVSLEKIRSRAREILENAKKIAPTQNTIAIGSEYIRLESIADSLFLFCLKIESGNSVADSEKIAKENARLCASNLKKNRPKDYQVHIWEGHCDIYIDWAASLIVNSQEYRGSRLDKVLTTLEEKLEIKKP